jgi:hypothetical protein
MTIDRKRLRELALAATPGPYFVGSDDAEECGPHANSGLSLVDTGRREDWPIARLCESASAAWIAAANPQTILELLDALEAAEQRATPEHVFDGGLLSRYDDESGLAARETLAVLMSEISEECYCAGWLIGNEFRLWHAITDTTDDLQYGMGEITREQVEQLRTLSAMCGGWVAWDDKDGAVFVPLAEWKQRIATIAEQAKGTP